MAKIVRLTENDLVRLVKKVIKEEVDCERPWYDMSGDGKLKCGPIAGGGTYANRIFPNLVNGQYPKQIKVQGGFALKGNDGQPIVLQAWNAPDAPVMAKVKRSVVIPGTLVQNTPDDTKLGNIVRKQAMA